MRSCKQNSTETKKFKLNDCFKIPWSKEYEETIFVVYEYFIERNGRQLLFASDINDEETIISIYDDEVLKV